MSWFRENGWIWDKRDHMWKRVFGEKELVADRQSQSKKEIMDLTISKPFTKVNNTLIVDNIQYPLKFCEVMYKK